jgi:long-chain fatty acid transport protein
MRIKAGAALALSLALLAFTAPPATATDGHFLHGVGAVNSAMGGAGVAYTGDLLGALNLNPAALHTGDGETRAVLSFELFKADRTISSSLPGGMGSGSTQSKSEFVPVPAFGWSTALNDKVTVAFGGLGIGGFGVDYAQDNTNPVLGPRQMGGFGQVYSNFSLMKITPAIAFEASEKLQLGFALNIDWSSLAVDPFPAAAPAFDPGTGTQIYSGATAADGAFGFGFQAGLIFKATDALNLGLAYTSKQDFQDYEYNSTYQNPNLANFGQARVITFAMDAPAVYAAGLAFENDALTVTADAKYITYSKTDGFDESGFDATGTVLGFGWEDIWVYAAGLQLEATEGVFVRGGWNYSENPIPDALSLFNIPAPAIVQQHATFGFGFQAFENVMIDLGYYHVFENSISGPMFGPMGPIDGSSVTSSMLEDSFLMTFQFTPGS